jgi:hypothetical protein
MHDIIDKLYIIIYINNILINIFIKDMSDKNLVKMNKNGAQNMDQFAINTRDIGIYLWVGGAVV